MYNAKINKRHSIGKTGEDLSLLFLLSKKHLFVSRNFIGNGGEIDLISMSKTSLHFTEVKSSSKDLFISKASNVSYETITYSIKVLFWVIRETFKSFSFYWIRLLRWRIVVSYETHLDVLAPIDRVSPIKRQRILRAINYFFIKNPQYREFSSEVDVIEVLLDFHKKFAIIRFTEQITNV